MDDAAKVYSECLFEKNKNIGLPVWHPQPQLNSEQYGEVQLADVGLISESGYFIKVFNCCSPPDPAGITTPSSHVPFRIPNEFRSWTERQAEYRSNSVWMVDISADTHLGLGDLAIGLKCTSKRGAALFVSQEGLRRERIDTKKYIREYVNTHYSSWQCFATSKYLPPKNIFFVGGFAKAQSWLVVAFTERYIDGGVILPVPTNTNSVRLWGSWRQTRSPRYNYGPEGRQTQSLSSIIMFPPVCDAQGDIEMASINRIREVAPASSLGQSTLPFTQCVFIERYTRKSRWSATLPLVQEAITTNSHQLSSETDQPSRCEDTGDSGLQQLPNVSGGDHVLAATDSLEDGSDNFEDLESLKSSDSAEDVSHDPLDILLEYMLESCSESKVAIAGDQDLVRLMPEGIDDVYQFHEQLVKLKPLLKFDQNGVVTLDLEDCHDTPILDMTDVICMLPQNLVGILQSTYDQYRHICHNQEKSLHLIRRSENILVAIDNEIIKYGQPDKLKDAIDHLGCGIIHVRDVMSSFAKLSFLKSLLRRDEISRSIVESHDNLNDCLQRFNFTALIRLKHFQSEHEEAKRKDAQFLESKIALYAHHNQEALRELKIQEREMIDAFVAMQRNVTDHQDKSPESRILKIGIEFIERSNNLKAGENLPHWIISSFEVDIDMEEEELGSGGFGVVRKGTWNGLLVAVKMMTSETSQEMLSHEVKKWSTLSHENVLQFYGASLATDAPFIVSRYMRNGNLPKYLRQQPNSNRVKLIHDVALGMQYIHYMNIIHGDLKGTNVLIDDMGKACIADFGLSKIKYDALSQSSTAKGQPLTGTMRFMAPEVMGGRASQAGDIYSFGMLIYQVFTNEVPFQAVPEDALLLLIGRLHRRLSRPTSEDAAKRGLTNDMWELLWECSNPISGHRPEFSNIIVTTADLVKRWQPVPSEQSDDGFNLLKRLLVDIQDSELLNDNTNMPTTTSLASDITIKRQLPSLKDKRRQVKSKGRRILKGHAGEVFTVAFSPDGARLASGSGDNTIRLWDPATGAHLFTLQDHTASMWTLSFSPDGALLASGSWDHTVRLWDPATGAHLFALRGHTATVWAVTFSPDGARLASGSGDSTIRLWDPVTGAHLFTLHGHVGPVWTVAFSPNSARLASGSRDNTIRLWDPATGAHLFTLHGHTAMVFTVVFSPNGVRLASGSKDNTIRLWDPATGAHLFTLQGHTAIVWTVAFSPDGTHLASVSEDKTIRLWES